MSYSVIRDSTQLSNPTATWADCGRTSFAARCGFCSFNDMLFTVDFEAIWCRSLEKEGQWTKFADVPIIEKGGGALKRSAPEPVEKFEGEVRALKQWRGDLITKCDEAKAAYQKALGASSAACHALTTLPRAALPLRVRAVGWLTRVVLGSLSVCFLVKCVVIAADIEVWRADLQSQSEGKPPAAAAGQLKPEIVG